MLLDDGDDLPQLLEEVLTHVLITATDHTQEGRHHLRRGGEGRGGEGRGGEGRGGEGRGGEGRGGEKRGEKEEG